MILGIARTDYCKALVRTKSVTVEQAKPQMSSGRGHGGGSEFPSATLTGLWGGRWAASGMGGLAALLPSETVMAPDFAVLSAMQCTQTGETMKRCVGYRCHGTRNYDGEDDYAYTVLITTLILTRSMERATVAPPVDKENRHR